MRKVLDYIVLGGGCFWCTEAIFKRLKGVTSVIPGYSGGKKENPNYEEVCTGKTGHAEVVKIDFDHDITSLSTILDVFFNLHDPTTINQQGNDIGSQYRSIILYTKTAQKIEIENFIKKLIKEGKFSRPIVTEVKPLIKFYQAETYHQDYYQKNSYTPYCQLIISPKIKHLAELFGNQIS